MLHSMSQVLNPDELFNEEARHGDLETPMDRFHDLILAVFRSNASEAYRLYVQYPNREPDTDLIQDAAAWIQELVMPDVSQRDVAQSISRWVVSQTEFAQGGARIEPPQQNRFIGFM